MTMYDNYIQCGQCLIISTIVFTAALVLSFFRKTIANIISLAANAAATCLYIYPIAVLNGIPNEIIPKESIQILTNRIYPAIIVTISLAIVIFADYFSYDRVAQRSLRKNEKLNEKNRPLTKDEKII